MPEILLLGSTDITRSVAQAALDAGVEIFAIVDVGSSFGISYSKDKVRNARHVDLKTWCTERGIGHIPFTSYDDIISRVEARDVPLCLVAGWYHMIPRRFREQFPLGCLGFHASLLPQLRGGAPLNWAILTGLKETGVSLFEIADGVDTGLLYAQDRFPIGEKSTIGELVAASISSSAAMVRQFLPSILQGKHKPYPQVGEPTFGLQRQPSDSEIDWTNSSESIDRLVRASGRPYSGAFTHLNTSKVSIWSVERLKNLPCVHGAPGQIFSLPDTDVPFVVTGDLPLAILEATDEEGADVLGRLKRSGHQRFSSPAN